MTRCGGITGLLEVAGLSATRDLDLSAHCAPAISAHAFCAVRRLRPMPNPSACTERDPPDIPAKRAARRWRVSGPRPRVVGRKVRPKR
ncbi:hypothetical protein SSP24_03250 [Streptomyces spinoverrucosus]|uniref:Uncharacterized protein n=1 Tax=Streptomyces spinoverrucosus TaxID=284043 RepID=A0A4Y3VA44_9ACTN|nr:hypothetical protein SSP24_03250 [Streptomyces spinoverrucosus]GHB41362.1 hypothetical protein GCM10010397_09350 [Streptomyces spinoverrucosus]